MERKNKTTDAFLLSDPKRLARPVISFRKYKKQLNHSLKLNDYIIESVPCRRQMQHFSHT